MTTFVLENPLLPPHLIDRSTSEPRYPKFASEEFRKHTFRHYHWPSQMQQTPERLAKAGFLYTGHSDGVVCFYCGNGLQQWTRKDDPYVEHAKMNRHCSYLKSVRSEGFISDATLLQRMEEWYNAPATTTTKNHQPPKTEVNVVDIQNSFSLQECVVCLVRERCIAFKPCGHLTTCVDCSFQVQKCVICRQKIRERIKIYCS
jgi:baculoviral IAP repeat-containing protein 7/8